MNMNPRWIHIINVLLNFEIVNKLKMNKLNIRITSWEEQSNDEFEGELFMEN